MKIQFNPNFNTFKTHSKPDNKVTLGNSYPEKISYIIIRGHFRNIDVYYL